MTIKKTAIDGLFIVNLEAFEDERGYFMETFRRDKLKEIGIEFKVAQTSDAFNKKKGVIRGLHFQKDDAAELKIVRCTNGKIYDVVVDVRPDSKTFTKWVNMELSAKNKKAFFIPRGCIHGYQTLTDESLVQYCTDNFYSSQKAAGFRYNDPTFNIPWPLKNPTLSERDKLLPLFKQ